MWHVWGTWMDLAVNLGGGGSRKSSSALGRKLVETRGLEPLTPALQRHLGLLRLAEREALSVWLRSASDRH
jgi:hypothetical protein